MYVPAAKFTADDPGRMKKQGGGDVEEYSPGGDEPEKTKVEVVMVKWLIKEQPLYSNGKYCYGFTLLRVGERIVFIMETPKSILAHRRKARVMGGDHDEGLSLKIHTKLLDEEAERKRPTVNPRIARLVRDSKLFAEGEDTKKSSAEPMFRFKNGEELIEVSFAVSSEESQYEGLFVYQIFLQDIRHGKEVFRAQGVPSMVLVDMKFKQKALYLLICHVFKRKQEVRRCFLLCGGPLAMRFRLTNSWPLISFKPRSSSDYSSYSQTGLTL